MNLISIIEKIKINIKANPNNELILSSRVSSLASIPNLNHINDAIICSNCTTCNYWSIKNLQVYIWIIRLWNNNISNEGIVIQSLNDVLTKLCNNNIVCELSEYYGQLMQCGLVEILMNSTIIDLLNNISIEELLQDLELGTMNIK